MAATVRAVSAKVTGTTAAVTVTAPTGVAVGDLEVLIAATIAGGTITLSNNGGSAWTVMTGSPIDVTAGEKLYVWWRVRQTGDGNPQVTAASDHVIAARVAYTLGTFDPVDPLELEQSSSNATSNTAFSWAPAGVTTVGGCLVCCICTNGVDGNTQQVTQMANTSLTGVISNVSNHQTNVGGGGGFGMTSGLLAAAGAVGTFTGTHAGASPKSYLAFAVKPKPPELLSTLKDEFDAALDTTFVWKEKSAGAVWDAAWGGRVILPVTSGYNFLSTDSNGGYILKDSSVSAQVFVPAPGAGNSKEIFMEVIRAGQTLDKQRIYLNTSGGNWYIAAAQVIGGSSSATPILYDPVAHRVWRIRETAGFVYFEVSPDGVTWTLLRAGVATGWDTSNVYLNFSAGYYGTETASNVYVDNVNAPPSIEPSALLTDDFNRADATPPSGSWTGSWSGVWRITSNELNHPTATWDGLSWTDMVQTTDCVAIWDVAAVGADASHVQLFINRIELDDTGYFVDISPIAGGTTTAYLRRRTLGGDAIISGVTVTGAPALAVGDKLALKRVGNRIEYWHQKAGVWTLIVDATDAAPLTLPGAPGIFANGAYRFDNFAADPLPRGPVINEADTVTTSDSLTTVSDYVVAPTDTATASDAVAFDEGLGLTDVATTSDLLTIDIAVIHVLDLTDTATAADALTVAAAYELALADATTSSDVLVGDDGLALADAATAADALAIDESTVFIDSATPTDVLTADYGLVLADTSVPADLLVLDMGQEFSLADAATTADDLALTDGLGLADAVTTAENLQVDIGQEMALADTVPTADALVLGIDLVLADTATATDVPDLATAYQLSFADAVGTADTFGVDQELLVADTVPLAETLSMEDVLVLGDSIPTADAILVVVTIDCPVDPMTGTPLSGQAITGYWEVCIPQPGMTLGGIPPEIIAFSGGEVMDPVPAGLKLGTYLPTADVYESDHAPAAGIGLGAYAPIPMLDPVPTTGLALGSYLPQVRVDGSAAPPTPGLALGATAPGLQVSQAPAPQPAGLLLGAVNPKFVGATLLLPVNCVDTDLEDVACETPVLTNGSRSISLQSVSEPDLILEEVLVASVSLPDTES